MAVLQIEASDGKQQLGYASDLLVPKWFEKDPTQSAADDSRALLASAIAAARESIDSATPDAGRGGETVFDLWLRVYRSRVGTSLGESSAENAPASPGVGPPALVRGFGVALVERALIDAACRSAGLSFFSGLRLDLFGFRPGRVHAELASSSSGWDPAESIGASPSATVQIRHTVGLVDSLRPSDVPEQDQQDDDHPLSLADDIERYGLQSFKIKVQGKLDLDLQRLRAIAEVLEERTGGDYQLTLDGNEQYDSLTDLRRLLEQMASDHGGQRFVERILYIEQPLPRARSFDPEALGGQLRALDDYGGVILDEADSGIDAFPRAIDLGYRGISVKNCKGVFRALLNRGLCQSRSTPRRTLFQSSEDLTNLPIHALHQDLATLAALGLEHSERNGHHYFRGLDHLSPIEVERAIERHGGENGLYQAQPTPRLRIEHGRLDLGSLERPGFGTDIEPDLESHHSVWTEVGEPETMPLST